MLSFLESLTVLGGKSTRSLRGVINTKYYETTQNQQTPIKTYKACEHSAVYALVEAVVVSPVITSHRQRGGRLLYDSTALPRKKLEALCIFHDQQCATCNPPFDMASLIRIRVSNCV